MQPILSQFWQEVCVFLFQVKSVHISSKASKILSAEWNYMQIIQIDSHFLKLVQKLFLKILFYCSFFKKYIFVAVWLGDTDKQRFICQKAEEIMKWNSSYIQVDFHKRYIYLFICEQKEIIKFLYILKSNFSKTWECKFV